MPMSDIPEAVQKTVGPFVKRAMELHNVQPLVSYYCSLYAAQLILESKLHLQDENVAQYIEVLLTQVETDRKAIEEGAPKVAELLIDKEKSFKLVLGFSMQILNKAVTDIDNHVATKRTVQSLMAFKDFVEITKLWPEFYQMQEKEITNQVKYAKYHSGRILKAFKNGEDPNDFVTESDEQELEKLLGKESSQLEGEEEVGEVEVKEDETQEIAVDEGLKFPEAPSTLPEEPTLNLPATPALIKGQKNSLGLPTAPEFDSSLTSSLFAAAAATAAASAPSTPPAIPKKPQMQTDPVSVKPAPLKPVAKIIATANSIPTPADNGTVMTKSQVEEIWKRDDIISKVQKRAKFAISALNYNDTETAINELQLALDMLRGSHI